MGSGKPWLKPDVTPQYLLVFFTSPNFNIYYKSFTLYKLFTVILLHNLQSRSIVSNCKTVSVNNDNSRNFTPSKQYNGKQQRISEAQLQGVCQSN